MDKKERLIQLNASLKKKFIGKKLVQGVGSFNAKIVFVIKSPDEHEEKAGKLLVGPRAKAIAEFLKANGLTKRSIYVTSVLKYRSPAMNAPPLKEIKAAVPFLREELKIIEPKVIVTLGPIALIGIGLRQPLYNMHGKSLNFGSYTLFPMFNPSKVEEEDDIKASLAVDSDNFKKLIATLT